MPRHGDLTQAEFILISYFHEFVYFSGHTQYSKHEAFTVYQKSLFSNNAPSHSARIPLTLARAPPSHSARASPPSHSARAAPLLTLGSSPPSHLAPPLSPLTLGSPLSPLTLRSSDSGDAPSRLQTNYLSS